MNTDGIVMLGGSVKSLGIIDGKGHLGGYLVVFSEPGPEAERDLAGQYFTKSTYLGPSDGNGVDGAFHHCLPIKGMEEFADHLFAPVKTKRDEVGIWAEYVLDMANKYERAVYKLGDAGKLGQSSGSSSHMVRADETTGEIKRWPIIEASLTPTPCEPRARALALKALEAETGGEAMTAIAAEMKLIFDSQEEAEEAFQEAACAWMQTEEYAWRLEHLAAVQRRLIESQHDVIGGMLQLSHL